MIQKRLKQLRTLMQDAKVDYYFVPAADAHRNEYVPENWQRRAWISGFTGSAGDALIGLKQSYLWTDGRYFLQAEQQLNPDAFQLMKQAQQGVPSIDVWLAQQGKNIRVGVDPKLLTVAQYKRFQTALDQTQSELVSIENNWIDLLWEDQPPIPSAPILRLDFDYTGRHATDKIGALRKALKEHAADAIVMTRLDAIAWLLNIRGNDIAYNPLVISYLIATQDQITLFINPEKISKDDKDYFASQGVTVDDYNIFDQQLQTLKGCILLDSKETSWWTMQQLQQCEMNFAPNPITLMKAIKNNTEQNGMREAHRIDAIAMVKFLHWIETTWQDGITEIDAAAQLEQFRRDDKRCKDLSFNTISGFASNGAIIHYSPNENSNKIIDDSALYLVDSGGQYFEGTTDITRTIHLGKPTAEEKRHYTLVLQAQLALRHHFFPPGTCGENIDSIARTPIQNAGYNYAHGTGHGVGCYLCVHEGPQCIAPRATGVPLQPGMVVSNEPGLYFKDRYGIRIENLCLIIAVEGGQLYHLDDLTLVPYARNLIDTEQLRDEEIDWIDTYHQTIFERIGPHLSIGDKKWLEEATKPLK